MTGEPREDTNEAHATAASTRVAFWNCGGRHSDANQVLVNVRDLLASGVSLLGLCELDANRHAFLREQLGAGCEITQLATGRNRWDLAIVYRAHDWEPTSLVHSHVVRIGARTAKAGCEYGFKHLGTGGLTRVWVVHWPSRVRGTASEFRPRCAQQLKTSIAEALASDVPVIVLGDFNDEPWQLESGHFNATRDREKVTSHPAQFLFNPFWGLLGYPRDDRAICGTHFFPDGLMTRWHTFDQILVSAAFLEQRAGLTFEAAERVVDGAVRLGPGQAFDHYPVSITLSFDVPSTADSR